MSIVVIYEYMLSLEHTSNPTQSLRNYCPVEFRENDLALLYEVPPDEIFVRAGI